MAQESQEEAKQSTETLSLAVNFNKGSEIRKCIDNLFAVSSIKNNQNFSLPASYHFHVGLIRIPNVKHEHFASLKRYLGAFIQSQLRENETLKYIKFTPTKCDRYIVGKNRSFDKSPIVLYPTIKETNILKSFNQLINARLNMFNVINNTNYQAGLETDIKQYTPHITLLIQPWIKTAVGNENNENNNVIQKFKDFVIAEMNAVIDKNEPTSQLLPYPNFKYN